MTDPIDHLSREVKNKLRRRVQPEWTQPMLATLTREHFSHPEWIYERKLDGVRCLAFRSRDSVRILSRNRNCMNDSWPELVDSLEKEPCQDFIVDGEIVTFKGNLTSFSRLQKRIGIKDPKQARERGVAVYLYLFDLIHINGYDTTQVTLRHRKSLLKQALSFQDRLRFTPHRNKKGEKFLEEACGRGWEGLIAKKADSVYQHQRSRDWLKFKCVNRQEFVIGGYTNPQGDRIAFGALLIGYYERGALRFAGRVGTGFDHQMLEDLGGQLKSMERKTSPFEDEKLKVKNAHWVTTKLVGEVAFTEWTRDGRLRHPRFLGLRADKPAEQVVRERPKGSSAS